MSEETDEKKEERDRCAEKAVSKRRSSKVKIGEHCFIGEHAVPQVRWVEGATCPECDGDQLMDAKNGLALCVSCNKFVKPKKTM
jgi:hypothetical protein